MIREFDFGECGSITVEGQKQYVEAFTGLVEQVSGECHGKGMLSHQIIRRFAAMMSDERFKDHFPQLLLKGLNIKCPEGKLCLN